MKVSNVQSGQNFGMAFKVNRNGAWRLAYAFVDDPKFETQFMKKIVGPLEKADANVGYNGYSAYFKHVSDDYYSSIVNPYLEDYVIMPMGGSSVWTRNVYRPQDRSKLKYTKDFEEFPNALSEIEHIEAAKNIALNLSAERAGTNLDIYDIDSNYTPPTLGKTVKEKMESLMKLFGVE